MYVRGLQGTSAIAKDACLSNAVTAELLEEGRELKLVETLGLRSAELGSDMRFNLTSKGIEWATAALDLSQYVGPVPVSLEAFSSQVETQRLANEEVGRAQLEASFAGLVLADDLLERLGPAANSAKSVMLYGSAGNGKTRIAQAITDSFQDVICLPYSIEVDGQIINFFDEHVHQKVKTATEGISEIRMRGGGDPRWVQCRRPVTLVGGELTLDMLDLVFNPVGKFYEAPAQLKATGGVFVLDDFGRQRSSATSILNRWIVPLERGIDYLSLHTGKKFPVPFDELVIFSTNLLPNDIGDDALLRRLYYKIEVPPPTAQEYARIWQEAFDEKQVAFGSDMMDFIEREIIAAADIPRAGFHARYILDQVSALCHYQGIPIEVNKHLLYQACSNLFTLPGPPADP